MITTNNLIKCDFCGKFIKFQDIVDGLSYNRMITPESDISYETFESSCRRCVIRYNLQKYCYEIKEEIPS